MNRSSFNLVELRRAKASHGMSMDKYSYYICDYDWSECDCKYMYLDIDIVLSRVNWECVGELWVWDMGLIWNDIIVFFKLRSIYYLCKIYSNFFSSVSEFDTDARGNWRDNSSSFAKFMVSFSVDSKNVNAIIRNIIAITIQKPIWKFYWIFGNDTR